MKSAELDKLLRAVKGFEPIALEDLPGEVLMERIDRKFAFRIDDASHLIADLAPHYRVIEIGGRHVSQYQSMYFDTSTYAFYSKHQRGFKNRVKVRYRSYPETHTTYLEVKRKNNKSFTTKDRVSTSAMKWPFSEFLTKFIKHHLPELDPSDLSPSVHIDYERIGFISLDEQERFSLDFNIRFSKNGKEQAFENLAILEVKQPQYQQTPVVKAMRAAGVEEQSMSKYCLALSRSEPSLRSNNFKPVLRRIEKITHE